MQSQIYTFNSLNKSLRGGKVSKEYLVGLDVGSTTVKLVVLNESHEIIFSEYRRHFSEVLKTVEYVVGFAAQQFKSIPMKMGVTGSGGLFVSELFGLPFFQEVVAGTKAVEALFPETDVAIELGGEDAKITYFGTSVEQRMNGVCAGGTGAFIDQMAILLNSDPQGLNELAKNYTTLHPIASRCGVFAKTDLQPLINEGIPKNDLAVSIFQAVVNQTISGLACGRPIKGKVAFLGGPLYFLSELRGRFIETLGLTADEVIFSEVGHFIVAIGTAMEGAKTNTIKSLESLLAEIKGYEGKAELAPSSLIPLFNNEQELKQFKARHSQNVCKRKALSSVEGPIFIGIDAGSTTTKVIALDQQDNLVFEFYGSNQGNPLTTAIAALKKMYQEMPVRAFVGGSAVTGYGEHLLKAALSIDEGEIETIAHYKAAEYFMPGVTFIIDIGGQDMKSMKVNEGYIESIMLNEACSSGCGSFIETFAKTLDMSIEEFSKQALEASNPVDLGTRCTVFMNSKVKQAQKDGATIADLSAGIAYSVVKNALYKVIRLRNANELGNKIVVQGGTFINEAVLRAFEIITGKEVVRTDISGLMGAFGAGLIAKESYVSGTSSALLPLDQLERFIYSTESLRCSKCGNACLMTVSKFSNGAKFISGNRCERGAVDQHVYEERLDLYAYKYQRVFQYKALTKEQAPKGTIGIPRVLNIYENYPFWHTFFTELGYRVVLSGRSSKEMYLKGMDSIASESVCYPAKLVHGHIEELIEKGVKTIFYPSIPYEIKESHEADNHYNCPIVTSYPETIRLNVENLEKENIRFINPFLPLYDRDKMVKMSKKIMKQYGSEDKDVERAIDLAYGELLKYKNDIRNKAEEMIFEAERLNKKIIVLAGRPYHIDPEINHGIPQMIANYGIAVLSEDAVAQLTSLERPLRVVDQWAYHTRLYKAAEFVGQKKNMELIQLNSFGCGLDAVTSDQVQEILKKYGKVHTVLKIDEINNLGAARIRVRSLMALMNDNDRVTQAFSKPLPSVDERIAFTKAMKETHTIIAPQMSPIHFRLFKEAFKVEGYNLLVLPSVEPSAIEEGLQYVHNDACYPSIITIGQIMMALKSGEYDLKNTSVMISQTGGGCRATNYIGFLRKALKDAGMSHVPVISLNAGGLEKNDGFKITAKLLHKLAFALIFGDLLMRLVYEVRPYEKNKGDTDRVYEVMNEICLKTVASGSARQYKKDLKTIVDAFATIEVMPQVKPKVGIVGEILVKYHPTANNELVNYLESEGAEVIVPDLADFLLYSAYNNRIKYELLGTSVVKKWMGDTAVQFIEFYRNPMKKALRESKRFRVPSSIDDKANHASQLMSLGHQTGEGWFLTAEMIELLESDITNIACLQPFACLPNHITGKGMIKALKMKYPHANIAPIDYDPGSSEVNQINRLKLMLSNAAK